MRLCIVLALVLVLASSAFAIEKKAYRMKEDFGTENLYDSALNYYYYIPCAGTAGTSSWFWSFTGWTPGEVIGSCFTIGDEGTGGWDILDPATCHTLEIIRILDFAGYGTVYPAKFAVEFDVYCADECCGTTAPVLHLWNSGPFATGFAWNYIFIDEPYVCLTPCYTGDLSFVVTATHTGTDGIYPAWGMDNISTAFLDGCLMHDYACLPAVYPRVACGTVGPMVHGGYIGTFPFEYWPPLAFIDGADTTPDGSIYGAIELAWRVYIGCYGETATEPSSWGNIKSMYR